MGGEFLTSLEDGGGSAPVKYSEIFKAHEPFYLSIGMSRAEYWNGEADLTKTYRKVYELKREQRNYELWLQGLYIYEALIDASPLYHDFIKGKPKPLPYSKEPYPLTAKEAETKHQKEEVTKMEKGKALVEAWAKRVNSKIKGKENG